MGEVKGRLDFLRSHIGGPPVFGFEVGGGVELRADCAEGPGHQVLLPTSVPTRSSCLGVGGAVGHSVFPEQRQSCWQGVANAVSP